MVLFCALRALFRPFTKQKITKYGGKKFCSLLEKFREILMNSLIKLDRVAYPKFGHPAFVWNFRNTHLTQSL